MLAALLSLVLALFLYDLWRALSRGEIGWGEARRSRSDQPAEYWAHLAFTVFAALAMAVSLIWYVRNGAWPELQPLNLVLAVWASALLIRALASGRASVGTVSFARHEEPREYWTLSAVGILFVALLWATILLKAYSLWQD